MATTTWTRGTITLTNGSATVTGDGTEWDLAELEGGETLAVVADPPIDFSMTVQTVVGAEEIALTAPWTGATLEDVPYQITRDYTGAPANAPIPQRGDMNPWAIIAEGFRRLNNAIASIVPVWGSITGTLADQTDLQNALDGKLDDPEANGIVVRTGDDGASVARTITGTANQVIVSNGDGVSSDPTIALDASVYRRANILGSVSQSGGVPTGAIVERGSNANGEYVRFADGTQICWISNFVMTYLNAHILLGEWTYPAAFSATPSGGITFGNAGGNYNNVTRDQLGLPLQNNSTTVGQYSVYRSYGSPDFDASASITNIKLHAIGRWY